MEVKNWKQIEIDYYIECLKNVNQDTDDACLAFNKTPKELFKWFKEALNPQSNTVDLGRDYLIRLRNFGLTQNAHLQHTLTVETIDKFLQQKPPNTEGMEWKCPDCNATTKRRDMKTHLIKRLYKKGNKITHFKTICGKIRHIITDLPHTYHKSKATCKICLSKTPK